MFIKLFRAGKDWLILMPEIEDNVKAKHEEKVRK